MKYLKNDNIFRLMTILELISKKYVLSLIILS